MFYEQDKTPNTPSLPSYVHAEVEDWQSIADATPGIKSPRTPWIFITLDPARASYTRQFRRVFRQPIAACETRALSSRGAVESVRGYEYLQPSVGNTHLEKFGGTAEAIGPRF